MKRNQRRSKNKKPWRAGDAKRALLDPEERFQCIIDLSSDYYWEQDSNDRFTLLHHRDAGSPDNDPRRYLGKTSWQLGGTPVDGSWDEHRALRARREPFSNFLVLNKNTRGRQRCLSISGQPVFSRNGRFLGYRGITRDVTSERRQMRMLQLERAVIRILADADTFSGALRDAIRVICESEGWEAGQYWSLDETRPRMRFDDGWHIARPAIEKFMRQARSVTFTRGAGTVGAVWKSGEPLWIPDLSKERRALRKDITRRTGWHTALLFPVLAKAETIGVLEFNAPFIEEPDERLLQAIDVLGTQIGNFWQRMDAAAKLRESEELYASTFELAAIGITHVAPDGRFIQVNRQFCDMLYYSRAELLERTLAAVAHPDDAQDLETERLRLHAGTIGSLQTETRFLRKDGATLWAHVTAAAKRSSDGTTLHDILVVDDVSERKLAEERARYLATHDEMTGLPNRAMFGHLANHAVENARRHRRKLAVLFIDLDGFKIINDSLGHEAGDLFLKEISARLKRSLRASDVLARLGGDEFVVLVEECREQRQVTKVARNILATVLKPVEIMGHECRVTASIGISVYPNDADDLATLMKNADMAMYAAKDEGRNNHRFYSRGMRSLSLKRLALETNLRRALERNELSLQYQAKVSIKSDRITGVEALLRWCSHDLGTVSPARFIPLAEENGCIVPMGKWVLETACAQAIAWRDQGLPAICLAVNLSPRQFRDPGLVADIASILAKTGWPAELLELEITEGMIMHNVDRAAQTLSAIKGLGVRLAIDDFGTGYSSLAQLKQFPIDTLKIDRSFIREIPDNSGDRAITEAIIALGRKLQVTVVAEGVENVEQYDFLTSRACDEMQGYWFSKPTQPNVFADLLRKHTPSRRRERRGSAATVDLS